MQSLRAPHEQRIWTKHLDKVSEDFKSGQVDVLKSYPLVNVYIAMENHHF